LPIEFETPLVNLPDMDSFEGSVYSAYIVLSENRTNNGFGPSKIKIADIIDYEFIFGSVFPIDILIGIVLNIDSQILKYYNKRKEDKDKKAERDKINGKHNPSSDRSKDSTSFRFRQ